jgi:hypothetical protein
MFDIERAQKLEELADLANQTGDHQLEIKALSEMHRMRSDLEEAISLHKLRNPPKSNHKPVPMQA